MSAREEWHVTVKHGGPDDVVEWYRWCRAHATKPLYIELSNFDRLTSAARKHFR